MDESQLTCSLQELDRRCQNRSDTQDLLRVSDLQEIARRRKVNQRNRFLFVAVSMVAVGAIAIGFRAVEQPEDSLVATPVAIGSAVVSRNASRISAVRDERIRTVLRESTRFLDKTEVFLAECVDASNASYVDDASLVSLAVARHYLSEGMIAEAKGELEMLQRALPNSIGGQEAAEELAAMKAHSNGV